MPVEHTRTWTDRSGRGCVPGILPAGEETSSPAVGTGVRLRLQMTAPEPRASLRRPAAAVLTIGVLHSGLCLSHAGAEMSPRPLLTRTSGSKAPSLRPLHVKLDEAQERRLDLILAPRRHLIFFLGPQWALPVMACTQEVKKHTNAYKQKIFRKKLINEVG